MSAKPYVHSTNDDTQDYQSRPDTPDASELQSLNVRLDRLKQNILSVSPYLLTVPSKAPFHLGDRPVNNWAVGETGLFTEEEGQLQYMTFLMHDDPDSLLVAVGGWSDTDGSIMAEDNARPPTVTSTTKASFNGPSKKKITLSDYKTRAKGDNSSLPETRAEQGSAVSVENMGDKKRENSNLQSRHGTIAQNERGQGSEHGGTEDASSRSSRKDPIHTSKKAREAEHSDAPLPKRPKLSFPTTNAESSRQSPNNNVIPALLSPTLPPTSISPKLPALLSPTLPPHIEEELARLEDETSIGNPSYKRDGASSSLASKEDTANSKSLEYRRPHSESFSSSSTQSINVKEREQGRKIPHHDTSGKFNRDNSTSGKNLHLSSRLPMESKTKSTLSTTGGKISKAGAISKQKLIVRLKYGRANRRRIEGLLKFAGKRKTLENSGPSPMPSEHHLSEEDVERRPTDVKPGEKRLKSSGDGDTNEATNKRPRALPAKTSSLEKPQTPVPVSSKSHSQHHHQQQSVSNSLHSTPKREFREGSQRRPESGDGEVKTPLGPTSKTVSGTIDRLTQSSPPLPFEIRLGKPQDTERRAWREEYNKYASLGRELKHVADRYKLSKATRDTKLAAATGVESILCFILAFIADDRSKTLARQVGDSSSWRSILAYWRVVKLIAAPYSHLHGLCCLLGAISHDAIHSLDLERLAVCSVPGDHSPVPTPGSDGATVTSDESKKQKKEFFDLKSRLPEYYREAHRLWLEGCRELSDDVLVHDFPETWAKRSRNFAERGQERLKVGNYTGDFFLPFGRTTTPLEAVRFGTFILGEWCRKEGLEFEARLKL